MGGGEGVGNDSFSESPDETWMRGRLVGRDALDPGVEGEAPVGFGVMYGVLKGFLVAIMLGHLSVCGYRSSKLMSASETGR